MDNELKKDILSEDADIAWSKLREYAKGKVNLYTNDITDYANTYCQQHPKLAGVKVFVANPNGTQNLMYVMVTGAGALMHKTRYAEELYDIINLLAGNNDVPKMDGCE